jgi:hypothetical protein
MRSAADVRRRTTSHGEAVHMEYGLQMYSVRDITKDDLDGALER